MREGLVEFVGKEVTITGVYSRHGQKITKFGKKTYVLFTGLYYQGSRICGHIWVRNSGELEKIVDLEQGDVLKFKSKVICYKKKSRGVVVADFGLTTPYQVEITRRKNGNQPDRPSGCRDRAA